MTSPEFTIEIAVDAADNIIGIKPPVDSTFREDMYGIIDELGLMKEIVMREGTFFTTMHSADGSAYSELRVPAMALRIAGVSLINLAHMSAEVLRNQQHSTEVVPFLKSSRDHQRLFSER